MSIIYEWEITGICTKTEGSNIDSVVEVNWIKRGIDTEGNVGEFTGTTPLTSLGSSSFTSFSSLTETNVLEWVQNAVSEDTDYHNEVIQEHLNILSNPSVEAPLPWA